jgi:Transposase zinc-ribbon domain
MTDLIKLTNLLDEAKCYDVIRQLRWPEGVVCLHCCGTAVTAMTIASGTDSDTCARHASIASMT